MVYEGIVLHDQDRKQKSENEMAMKFQQGTVYLQGKTVKKWYGKYLVYGHDQGGKEVRRFRNIALCPKANTPKWKAEQMLRELILKECNGAGPTSTLPADDSVTFGWFVRERYIPMRQGKWSPAYCKTNTFNIEHYLLSHFENLALRKLDTFGIQIWLNKLAGKNYSHAVVRQSFTNMRAITHLAKKQKYLAEDPGEDVTMPQTKPVIRPVISRAQIQALLGAIEDVHDLCLLHIGVFCGTRASEVLGLQWKSWTGEASGEFIFVYDISTPGTPVETQVVRMLGFDTTFDGIVCGGPMVPHSMLAAEPTTMCTLSRCREVCGRNLAHRSTSIITAI